MHDAVKQWTARWCTDRVRTVVDVGGRDINGTAHQGFVPGQYDQWVVVDERSDRRPTYPHLFYTGDFADWDPPSEVGPVDVVLCTETFEHTPSWAAIVQNAWRVLEPHGLFLCTTVTPAYPPHSAEDGLRLRDDEYYAGIVPDELEEVMEWCGFVPVLEVNGAFLNAAARKIPR